MSALLPSSAVLAWHLHVLLTLDAKGCKPSVAKALGLDAGAFHDSSAAWAEACAKAHASIAGWTPIPPAEESR